MNLQQLLKIFLKMNLKDILNKYSGKDLNKLDLDEKMELKRLLGIYFDWNIIEILIFLVFLWSIFRTIPSRYLAGVALCFLILVPIFLSLDRDERAEEFSIYAYYFFVMAVIRGIIEIRSEKNDEKNTEKS